MMWLTVPIRWISSSSGSFVEGSICEERKISRSNERAASRAAMDLSRPTKRGTTMCGKTTMSRRGRRGRIFFRSSIGRGPARRSGELRLLPLHDLRGDLPLDHVLGDDALPDVALRRDL